MTACWRTAGCPDQRRAVGTRIAFGSSPLVLAGRIGQVEHGSGDDHR